MTMIRLFVFLAAALCCSMIAHAQNSPPVGNNLPVQPTKTSNYTIKNSDLKTIIPMNCSSPCTVTMPHSTGTFPKGYPVIIQNVGSTAVTVSATTSTIYGLPLTSGSVVLTTQGNWVSMTADTANNYLAYGFIGSGGGGGGSGILLTCGTSLCTCGTGLCTE